MVVNAGVNFYNRGYVSIQQVKNLFLLLNQTATDLTEQIWAALLLGPTKVCLIFFL